MTNTLAQIKEKMFEFIENHPELYKDDENNEIWEEFNNLQDEIFNNNQVYLQWEVENDTFETDSAFDSILSEIKDSKRKIKDFLIDRDCYNHTYIFIEYEE